MVVFIVLSQVRQKFQSVLIEGLLRQSRVALRTIARRLLLLLRSHTSAFSGLRLRSLGFLTLRTTARCAVRTTARCAVGIGRIGLVLIEVSTSVFLHRFVDHLFRILVSPAGCTQCSLRDNRCTIDVIHPDDNKTRPFEMDTQHLIRNLDARRLACSLSVIAEVHGEPIATRLWSLLHRKCADVIKVPSKRAPTIVLHRVLEQLHVNLMPLKAAPISPRPRSLSASPVRARHFGSGSDADWTLRSRISSFLLFQK